MSTNIRNVFTSNQTLAIRDANAPSAANVFATMADVGGGGSDIYTTDGNILAGVDRVATIDNTATLTFAGASASGDFVIKGGHATAIQSLHTDASGYNFFDNYQLTIRTNISGTPYK